MQYQLSRVIAGPRIYENLVSGVRVTDPTMGTADANTTGPFLDNFVSGNTAMIIMANWWESALRTGMGDEEFANIATAPIPVGPSGESPSSISYSWMTVVSASADDAEAKDDAIARSHRRVLLLTGKL